MEFLSPRPISNGMEEKIKQLEEQLKKCEAERDEYLNGWKRAKADYINREKDEAQRFEEMSRFANKEFVKDLIVVLDSFDLAIAAAKDGEHSGGFKIIRAQLEDMMKRHGLERIAVAAGGVFDPSIHEAIAEIESESPPGTIAEEVERGYTLHGRVIKPARVKLSK